jgi:hypothetical protein
VTVTDIVALTTAAIVLIRFAAWALSPLLMLLRRQPQHGSEGA